MLIGAAVALVAIAGARLGSRTGLPALLLFLLFGILLGSPLVGGPIPSAQLAHDLGFAALVLILAEGGLTTKWREMRKAIGLAGLLATVGVAVSIMAVALFGYYVLDLPRAVAVLLGAVTAPTDSAAVFSVLRGLPLPSRVRSALEGESGLNDAPVVLLVSAGTAYALGHFPAGGVPGLIGMVALELAGGIVLGLGMGFAGVFLLRRIALPASGLYPLATLSWAITAYGLGVQAHVSGFAAVYVCAVMLGNGDLPHTHAIRSFAEGIGWISQIGLFVMLGMLSSQERINGYIVIAGLVSGLFLTFIARPLSVVICSVWFKIPWAEQVFLSWAGLRGAVPIILATVPVAAQMPDAYLIFDIVLVFVVAFTALQAPTLPWVARRLGLVDPHAATDVDIELAPLEERRADVLRVAIPDDSRLAGVTIRELRLPPNVIVALIMRGDESFSPDGHTILRQGDDILVVTPADVRAEVQRRLIAMGRGGRLAGWRRRTRRRPTDVADLGAEANG